MNMIKLIVLLSIFLSSSLYAQSTQVRNWGTSLNSETDYIPNYQIAEFDNLGSFGRPNPNPFRLINSQSIAPNCVPINSTGIYTISVRGVWSIDDTVTGTKALSIRVLRDGIWSTLAQNFTNSPKDQQLIQTVIMMDVLNVNDCIGTLASFTSQTANLNFGVASLLITKLCTPTVNRRRRYRR